MIQLSFGGGALNRNAFGTLLSGVSGCSPYVLWQPLNHKCNVYILPPPLTIQFNYATYSEANHVAESNKDVSITPNYLFCALPNCILDHSVVPQSGQWKFKRETFVVDGIGLSFASLNMS